MAEALKASIPLIVIVQDVPRSMVDRNAFQEFDHLRLFDACAKWVRRVDDPQRIDDYVDMAFVAATSGRSGPAVLIVPMDVFRLPAQPKPRSLNVTGTYPIDRQVPQLSDLEKAAEILAKAERPLIVAGGGVHLSGASHELEVFVQATGIPVATTNMGKGAVNETGELALGVFGNAMGTGTVAGRLRWLATEADVILLLGTRTNQNGTDSWTLFPKTAKFIHLDVDPIEIGRNYESLRLTGDLAATLPIFLKVLVKRDISALHQRCEFVKQQIVSARFAASEERKALPRGKFNALRPERVMEILDSILLPEDIVLADASYSTNWVNAFLTSRKTGARFITPRGLAGLGWGFPMALGARAAQSQGRVFVLEGDGGFGHCWQELETSRRMNLPVVLLVLNNGILGYQLHAEHVNYGMHSDACTFESVDHAAIARACGCHGERVCEPDEVRAALDRAIAYGGTAMIEFMIDPDAYPPLSLFEGKEVVGDKFFEVGL